MRRANSLRSSRTTVQASTGSTWSGGSRTCSVARCGSSQVKRQTRGSWSSVVRIFRRPVPVETLPAELRERLILYGVLTTLDGDEAGRSRAWLFRRRVAKLSVC